MVGEGTFEKRASLQFIQHPTKRAPDAGDSAHIPSIFLRLVLFHFGRRSAARPSAGNANRSALALQKRGTLLELMFYNLGRDLTHFNL
jgi:hypothetical protein